LSWGLRERNLATGWYGMYRLRVSPDQGLEKKGPIDLLAAMKLTDFSHKVLSGDFRIPVKHINTSLTAVQWILHTSKNVSGIPRQNKRNQMFWEELVTPNSFFTYFGLYREAIKNYIFVAKQFIEPFPCIIYASLQIPTKLNWTRFDGLLGGKMFMSVCRIVVSCGLICVYQISKKRGTCFKTEAENQPG
jgi:hypothetical protein